MSNIRIVPNKLVVDPKVTSVKKFYFLEYFYILLKSIEESNMWTDVFAGFTSKKEHLLLGESKYRKLIPPEEKRTTKKLMRYEYTFNEVVDEAVSYSLLDKRNNKYTLTNEGKEIIKKYEKDVHDYNSAIFELMESKFQGFYYLVGRCYEANTRGLLIFPIYSPLKLGIQKSSIKKTRDLFKYIDMLTERLMNDVNEHLQKRIDLSDAKSILISKLCSSDLIDSNLDADFNVKFYNAVVKRIRDYWLNYFLKDIYKIEMSLSYFDIWCYRGKQLGIMNATEFFYNFDGKIVYPISVLSNDVRNGDFNRIFQYQDGLKLYVHQPDFDSIQEDFTSSVFESYIDIKSRVRTYFINLADLRDLVCYKLRISNEDFSAYLENLYQLNLRNEVKIKISLETDKLPSETNAMYLTREPIMIDNQPRNIIAIDIQKATSHE